MNDTASFENNEKFAGVEKRLKHVLNRDEDVKANYSELRNYYSIICNDIKGAISKRLSKLMQDVLKFNTTFIKGKTPKKDTRLAEIERDFNSHLHSMPDINPQNVTSLYQFLRELMPMFIHFKSHTAGQIRIEKKIKKRAQLEDLLQKANLLSRGIHEIFSILQRYHYFEQYLLILNRARVNRDYTRDLIRDMHAVVKQAFKSGKNETLDIGNFQVIELLTLLIRIRLGIHQNCELYGTYTGILKNLPRQLVQQFNARYLALRRKDAASIEELKDSAEYKDLTKKFITLKLKKYYDLLRLYQINVNRLFIIEDRVLGSFKSYLAKTETAVQQAERARLIEALQPSLFQAVDKYLMIDSGMPRNQDLKNNSIRTLFSFMISYYYNVLKDTYTPLSSREIALRSMKLVKPPKELTLNAIELKYLDSAGFKRDERILEVFFQGILKLLSGEAEETVIVEPIMKIIGENTRRAKKNELRDTAIKKIINEISPMEFELLVQILETVPRDQERIDTDLGKLYIAIAEQYPNHLRQIINRLEKVEPTDSEKEKLRKTVNDKYQRLLMKTVELKTDSPSAADYLKKVKDEEHAFAAEVKANAETLAGYNIGSLLTQWKNETEKTVIGLLIKDSAAGKFRPGRYRDLSRQEISGLNAYFSSEHLGEMEKHYKTLSECVSGDYLKSPKPYTKIEYILLYAAKRLMVEFRNPAKSYPRLHERLTAISSGK